MEERPATKRNRPDTMMEEGDKLCSSKRRLADEGTWSSDSDYDDLDAMITPSDLENLTSGNEDDEDEEDDDDDSSIVTTGSNTPSVVGENLESFSLTESEKNNNNEKEQKKRNLGPSFLDEALPLSRSLFPHVPPSIHFYSHNRIPQRPLPLKLRQFLKWKLSNVTPAVIKRIVSNSGFRLLRKNTNCAEWTGTWGNHMKSHLFKSIPRDCAKINHFPGTFTIGRKDRLWKNYHRLKLKFGKEEFSFLPRTFCLPDENKLLRKVWLKRGGKEKWIVKPPALSRGNGIRVVTRWVDIPKCRPLIVQKYISRPHLINATKYDLRIYVLVTSLCPLKIYLFEDGLARFASKKYDADPQTLSDSYMHLTNYSINKNSSSYLPNEDAEVRQGHKWTLASLWDYFKENGIDHNVVWGRIKDLVIKTFISAEDQMYRRYRTNVSNHYSTYELFGFDVLLDAKLKPWLIEVNISPSLHSASPLDLHIKSALASEVFNIARFHIPPKLAPKTQKAFLAKLGVDDIHSICFDKRLYVREISKSDKAKQDSILNSVLLDNGILQRETYLESILEKLTPDDVRLLIRAEDELAQTKKFERIFPTKDTHSYFKFFEIPRYHNLFLDAWENKYSENRQIGIDRLISLCNEKVHLKVPSTISTQKKEPQIVNVSMLKAPTSGENTISNVDSIETLTSSIEPMSTGSDSAIQSENDKSRSPSPVFKTSTINGSNEISENVTNQGVILT
ncbi:tubulin monoglutamylase TTLL4 [Lepeophtheirus salmonis]|uniref:tubulin monoglutamylase TTLL4 n=1 Tax=Lepeophtheirus salmonis TaxID=72036 RepID=UPI001AE381C4|nr:tubulin polyglutamylase TTLL4-like [Lepeophtheirus salmonis]